MIKKAVVLISGGLDSTTCLAIARSQGYELYGMSILYGQRHSSEIDAAKSICKDYQVQEHRVVNLDIGLIGGSALTDPTIKMPESQGQGIPVTYVPARNTVLLSLALGWAEVLKAEAIFIGVNAVDYSGYPDCRPEYIQSFQNMAHLATKIGVEGRGPIIKTPLIALTKAEIIQKGLTLGVDYSKTVTCYQADEDGLGCGLCDACKIRNQGFRDANVSDVTRYRAL